MMHPPAGSRQLKENFIHELFQKKISSGGPKLDSSNLQEEPLVSKQEAPTPPGAFKAGVL